MMYLMCLFQALPHGAEDTSPAPSTPPAEALAPDDTDIVAVEVRVAILAMRRFIAYCHSGG